MIQKEGKIIYLLSVFEIISQFIFLRKEILDLLHCINLYFQIVSDENLNYADNAGDKLECAF